MRDTGEGRGTRGQGIEIGNKGRAVSDKREGVGDGG